MDTYINSWGTEHDSYQIIPTTDDGENSHETCWTIPAPKEPSASPAVALYPDFSAFQFTGTHTVNGVECNAFSLSQPEFNSTTGNIGSYVFYFDKATDAPIRYSFVGHNAVLGGHVDSYHIDYLSFEAGEPDDAVFLPSSVSGISSVDDCIPQPAFDDDDGAGPTLNAKAPHGPTHFTPKNDFAMFHPEGAELRHSAAVDYFAEHGKQYKDAAEHELRKSLFHGATRYINAVNRQKNTYVLGANHMADWTAEEKKAVRGRLQTSKKDLESLERLADYTHQVSGKPCPTDGIDWRGTGAVTAVKDQGTCGSCWSYGTTGAIEGQIFKKSGDSVEISQQNLMDCSWPEGNNACDGGLDFNAYAWIIKHGGIATSRSYGDYLNADGFCHFTDPDIDVGAKVTGYVNVTEGDVDALNDALVHVGPISVSIDASPDSFYYYKGGYYDNAECKNGVDDLDHTVLAVGFTVDPATGDRYSIVKNSWSTYWGMDGYVLVAQKGNVCGVATTPTYPILA
jgi:C1A family cysteine protease